MGSSELILAGALVLAALSVYLMVSTILTNNTDKDALSWASGNEPVKSKSGIINLVRPLVHNFTLQHAARVKDPKYRKRVEEKLLTGGLSRELNVDEFIGLQIFLGLMFPTFMLIMNFALNLEFPWIFFVLLFPFGIYYPHIYANAEKQRRQNSVRKDLPFFADLLALSTEAGLDFIGAIQRIVEKASEDSVLAEEFGIVLKDIKLGATRTDSLRGLSRRIESQEIISFVAVLVDADATGASISQVLKDQSAQIRLERFVRAEKAGAKASQAMLIPVVLFILPAVFLVVFGPIVVGFMSGGN
jgi:tight adherence protein C